MSASADSTISFSHSISKKLNNKSSCYGSSKFIGHNLHLYPVNPRIPSRVKSKAGQDSGTVSERCLLWEQQDALLLSWLQSSASTPILTKMTVFQLWDKLHSHFTIDSSKVQAVGPLHTDLLSTTLGNYENQVNFRLYSFCDPVSPKEQVDVILKRPSMNLW